MYSLSMQQNFLINSVYFTLDNFKYNYRYRMNCVEKFNCRASLNLITFGCVFEGRNATLMTTKITTSRQSMRIHIVA